MGIWGVSAAGEREEQARSSWGGSKPGLSKGQREAQKN